MRPPAETPEATQARALGLVEPLDVSVRPAGGTSVVGAGFTASALVRNGSSLVAGARVSFTASMPGQPVLEHVATTDRNGLAWFTFTRSVAGTDRVVARAVAGDAAGSGAAQLRWVEGHGLLIGFDVAQTATAVGEDFTPRVRVTADGRPLAGASVTFAASMPGQPTVTTTVTTGRDGAAATTYSRDTGGTDTLVATVSWEGRTAEATSAHLWRAASALTEQVTVPKLTVGVGAVPGGLLAVSGEGCPAGERATLVVDGRPVASADVGSDGTFSRSLRLPDLSVGRHRASVHCGLGSDGAPFDVVSPVASGSTDLAGGAAVVALLALLLLVGVQSARAWSRRPRRQPL